MLAYMAPVCQKTKDFGGAGGQIQSVLTMPESYAKQVSFQSSFESSERCTILTMSTGKEFQTAGAEQRKARSAK